jgi:methylenetetrahydrofolate reductase (NADPH)
MSLSSFFSDGRKRHGLSFELFPPKSADGVEALMRTVDELRAFDPDFFTCTYGAGGSTQDRTLEVAARVKSQFGLPVASHLTCVGSTVDQLREFLSQAKKRGVDFIVALRGDPPKGETQFRAVDGGLRYASELVRLIRAEFQDFGIAVAGYPEVHQEAVSPESDLEFLKRKVDTGADIVITQLFYNNTDFYRFVDRCRKAGIAVPIVPGILPVTNLSQIQRIASMCKALLPEAMTQRLARSEDPQWQFQAGVEYAQTQVRELLENGVPGIHFYVLNKSQATNEVLKGVGYRS